MLADATVTHIDEPERVDEQTWYDLYLWLLPLVELWVRDAQVSSWYGQQKEIAEDIAHEAVMRAFKYHQRAQDGELPAIGSLKALSRVIARNYFRDWRKKDWCLVRPDVANGEHGRYEGINGMGEVVDAAQIALDQLIMDSIIVTIAQVVARFPQGQKVALLTDLANMSALEEGPTRLEQAFATVGIRLSDYRRPRLEDPAARSRDAALRSIAYKRLKYKRLKEYRV
jgi:DNA-directed RNA polymerase specialized sigma24 family protein